MTDDDETGDQPLSRQQILDRYGWQPGEKEQIEREMAERQRRIDAEAREAEQRRSVERQQRPLVVDTQRRQADAASVKYWEGYIKRQLEKESRAMTSTVAKFVGEELNTQDRARKHAVEDLKEMIFDTQKRFHDHPDFAAIAALRQQIATLQARLDAIEAAAKTAPAQLRSVS